MKLACMIVDDEPLARTLLEKYIGKTDFLQLEYQCKNAVQAKQILKDAKVDVIFLDIHMPQLTGIEFSKAIDKNTRIIFTTAFEQYAIQGYKVNAIDYLLKPFDYDEFLSAALKAKTYFDSITQPIQPANDHFYVRSEYRRVKIELSKVLYFEGLKDYIKIWLENSPKPILTLMTLKSLENELPKSRFMRIHRSFIISLDKINSIEKNQILISGRHINIARQYKTEFLKLIGTKNNQ